MCSSDEPNVFNNWHNTKTLWGLSQNIQLLTDNLKYKQNELDRLYFCDEGKTGAEGVLVGNKLSGVNAHKQ